MSKLKLYESLEEEKRVLIEKHLLGVIEANRLMNITRIDDLETGLLLHVEDSLQAMDEVNDSPSGPYADLGSGGGFPGIPLGVACNRETLLVDAREKKMKAVKKIVGDLGLNGQFDVFAGRAELLARKRKERYAVVTARALSKLSVLLELASPLLMEGGRLVCFKAKMEQEELDDAAYASELVGMKLASDRSFLLANEYSRRILTYEKAGVSRIKLPRSEGAAQKNPLRA